MKICHVTTVHTALDTRIFRRECRSLVQAGHEVHLITNHDHADTIDGVHLHALPCGFRGWRRRILQTRLAFRMAAALRADIYQFHDPELLPWMAWLARRAVVVWDVHELYHASIVQHNQLRWPWLSRWFSSAFGVMELLLARRLAGIITATPQLADRYRALGPPVLVLRNLPDLSQVADLLGQAPVATDPVVVCSGTMAGRQLPELLQAMALLRPRVPAARLLMLSAFDTPEARLAVDCSIQSLGLEECVEILPPRPFRDYIHLLAKRARVGVVLYERTPNNLAGIPNRLFEYWAAGLPVVATATPNLSAYVEVNLAGTMVDSDSPQRIADALLPYLQDVAHAHNVGLRGRASVVEDLNWSREFPRLMEFYGGLRS